MMSYSNKYDAIPICRTHARRMCVHPNFQATTRATSDNFVACRSRCRFLCVHTLTSHSRVAHRYLSTPSLPNENYENFSKRHFRVPSGEKWLNKVQFWCFFNPFATVIVFFVDFFVCRTIVPYPANAS